MRKLIFDINITIDGFADHTSGIADDELHDFYTDLLNSADILLFGRKTYQLMESFWPVADKDPQSTKSIIRFADKINGLQKIVFSKTLNQVTWNNTKLVKDNALEEIARLKQESGKNLFVGGISFSSSLMNAGLIDEFWFLIHPIISGKGRQLFEKLNMTTNVKLQETQVLKSGVVAMHYLK